MDFQEFKREYDKMLLTADSQKAWFLLKLIDDDKVDFTAGANLEEFLVVLKWIALDRLPDQEVLKLFREHLMEGLNLDYYDLQDQVRNKFLGITENKWDEYKKELLKAIKNNNQKLNDNNYINTNNQALNNTPGLWVSEYLSFGGSEPLLNIKQLEFFKGNKNWSVLNLEWQERLIILFSLVEWLKHSSFSLKGSPEPTLFYTENGYYGIVDGQMVKLDDLLNDYKLQSFSTFNDTVELNKKTVSFTQLKTRYQEILGQLLPIGAVAHKGESHIPEVILDQLNNNLALKDTAGVVGNLQNLIQLKALSSLIKSRNFIADFSVYVEAHVGLGYKDELTRLTPEVFALFLQFLLSGKLKLSLEQSAVLTLHLVKFLGQSGQQELMTIAYGDLKTGAFKWREVTGENGKLRFK